MILLFTDFGWNGPYVGEMKAVLGREAPGVPAVDLMHDAPIFAPRHASYLLAALIETGPFPAGSVFLCVVDPGVGTDRRPLAVSADGRWLVGPDNGLLAIAAHRAGGAEWYRIDWRPQALSASFHGRDLFAPTAARLARSDADAGLTPLGAAAPPVGADWPDDLPELIYADAYGNAMTGLRAASLAHDATLAAGGHCLPRRGTFADVPRGEAFWYENSSGLAEIAVNRGSAMDRLGLRLGDPVTVGG